jgi:nitroreductase
MHMKNAMQPFFENRFSPKAFDGTLIEDGEIIGLIEAARWAPSAYNEQPWRFFFASRSDKVAFEAFIHVLNQGNQPWARDASALMFTAARRERRRDGETNPYAWHDLGQAVAYLTVRAYHSDIYLHQMQGFNPERARTLLNLPSGYDPVTAIAIGRPADGQEELARSRTRVSLDEIVTRFPSARD